jgi:molecular chaperone GrpE (heat shock protein)
MNYLRELNIRYEKALKGGEFSNSTQHSIDITPELKQQVSEGLPLFMASVPKEDFAEALNEYDNLIKNPKATTEYIKKFGLEKIKKIKDITSNFGTYIAALEKSNYITKKIC